MSRTSPTDPLASSVDLMTTGKLAATNGTCTTKAGTLLGSGRVARSPAALTSPGVSGKPIHVDFRKTFVSLKKTQGFHKLDTVSVALVGEIEG
jgi:hypothetical protein